MRADRSSGNVFRDLGFDDTEAENLRVRADLMIRLSKLIEGRGLTQGQAAKLLGVTQSRIIALLRGKIQLFSVDLAPTICNQIHAIIHHSSRIPRQMVI